MRSADCLASFGCELEMFSLFSNGRGIFWRMSFGALMDVTS